MFLSEEEMALQLGNDFKSVANRSSGDGDINNNAAARAIAQAIWLKIDKFQLTFASQFAAVSSDKFYKNSPQGLDWSPAKRVAQKNLPQ